MPIHCPNNKVKSSAENADVVKENNMNYIYFSCEGGELCFNLVEHTTKSQQCLDCGIVPETLLKNLQKSSRFYGIPETKLKRNNAINSCRQTLISTKTSRNKLML